MIICDTCGEEHPKSQYLKRIGSNGIFKDCEICRINLNKQYFNIEDVGYLYVIKSIHPKGFIKVGKTNDLDRRLKNYNSSFPEDVMEYEHTSEIIYNLNIAEQELIDFAITKNGSIRYRKEWFKYKPTFKLLKSIIHKIDKLSNKYGINHLK